MMGEIAEAARLGKEIRFFSKDISEDVEAIVTGVANSNARVEYDGSHTYLSLPAEAIIPSDQKGVGDVM